MTPYLSYRSLRKCAPCLFSHVKRMIFNQFAYRETFANVTLLYTHRYICMYVAPNGLISVGGAHREQQQQQQQEKQQINKSNKQNKGK